MKKTLFFFAVAACVAFANISCGSDDGGSGGGGGSIPTLDPPSMTEQAARYGITDLAIDKTEAGLPVNALLTGINVTESGKAVVEFLLHGKKKCATYDVQLTGDVYVMTDGNKVVGKFSMAKPVAKAPTRADSQAQMYITLEIEVPGVGVLKFDTAETPGVVSKMVDAIKAGGTSLTNIARTWKVAQMKLSLDGDITPLSMLEESGKLSVFVEEINKRNTGFSKEDIAKLNKEIKSITLDKNGMLSIAYTEGLSDAANWNWDAADFSKIGIQLQDSEMGNKFLSDNSSINVRFNSVGCTFTLTTNLEGSNKNKYIATLVLVLLPVE